MCTKPLYSTFLTHANVDVDSEQYWSCSQWETCLNAHDKKEERFHGEVNCRLHNIFFCSNFEK